MWHDPVSVWKDHTDTGLVGHLSITGTAGRALLGSGPGVVQATRRAVETGIEKALGIKMSEPMRAQIWFGGKILTTLLKTCYLLLIACGIIINWTYLTVIDEF